MSKAIKVGLVDDEGLFRRGLKALLSEYDDIDIILEAEDGQHLLDLLEVAEKPEILLLDLQMPRLSGVETTKLLQKKYPEISIIILTTHFSKGYIIKMIEMGAASYLPKNSEPEEVYQTITEVFKKAYSYNEHVMAVIRENLQKKIKNKNLIEVEISKREKEVLQLICNQFTTSEIAERLYISPRTVDGHRNKLLDKTGARNTAGLVVFALENNMVAVDNSWL